MSDLKLRRAIRGSRGEPLQRFIDATGAAVRVEDVDGKLLLGQQDAQGEALEICHDGVLLGTLVAPAELAENLRDLVVWLYEREHEKRGLVAETLGRYKELALLYELGEKLSRLLDLQDVAQVVVDELHQHLRATGVALLLHDQRRDLLEQVAMVGSAPHDQSALSSTEGVAGQVMSTGIAVFAEDPAGVGDDQSQNSLIYAPIIVGALVLGVLRLWRHGMEAWTSGDLKLVCAMAANASSAISAAQLYTSRMREVALLHRLQRHVSQELLAVLREESEVHDHSVIIACCDLREFLVREDVADPERRGEGGEVGVVHTMRSFLDRGGLVDTPLRRLVLGAFFGPDACEEAIEASREALRELEALKDPSSVTGIPGIGIASLAPGHIETKVLYESINRAAVLQSEASGLILVEQSVREHAPQQLQFGTRGMRELPGGHLETFEVQQ